jgi:prepilin-type N-terminal cleavage/methylation domain-containing protein
MARTNMQTRRRQAGFSLVELMVTLAITSFLLMAAAPFAADGSASAQVKEANSKLRAAYGLAKAMAIRNPNGVLDGSYTAASLVVLNDGGKQNLFVCASDASSSSNVSTCMNGTPVSGLSTKLWSAQFASAISLSAAGWPSSTLAGSSYVYLSLNNLGVPKPGYSTAYSLSRGGAANSSSGSYVSSTLQ